MRIEIKIVRYMVTNFVISQLSFTLGDVDKSVQDFDRIFYSKNLIKLLFKIFYFFFFMF